MDQVTVAYAVAVVGMLGTAVSLAMQQIFKPILESLPFMQPKTSALHDAILRLVVVVLNGALIVALSLTTPIFAGLAWYDLLGLIFGQSVVSHGVFKGLQQQDASSAGVPGVPMSPPGGAVG